MMEVDKLTIKIHVSKWFTWVYLPLFKIKTYLAMSVIHGYEPNLEKLEYWALKSVKVVK